MDAPHFNLLAIVTAALVTFAVGGLWYSPILFAKPWMRECGLTEEQAREAGHDVAIGKVQYGAVGAGTILGDRTGLVKLVGERR